MRQRLTNLFCYTVVGGLIVSGGIVLAISGQMTNVGWRFPTVVYFGALGLVAILGAVERVRRLRNEAA